MILIGQYDSPFVRRVGIALRLYGIPFRHETWSAFGDADKIRAYNPLTRVPTLVLDNGEVLIDSHMMLDYLDSLASDGEAMFPKAEPERHQALKIATLATGVGEKAVSLFYEKRLHTHVSEVWVERCRTQIASVLAVLEAERTKSGGAYWFGDRIGHADIAVATVLRFIDDAHQGLLDMAEFPALAADATRLEAMPVFKEISQEFIPPA